MLKLNTSFLLLLILLSIASISFATDSVNTPSNEARTLMTNISRNLKDLPDLSTITGDITKSSALQEHKEIKKWVERDYKKLIGIDPSSPNYSYKIWDIPFSKRLADGQTLIAKNDTFLTNIPDKKAFSKIESALFSCMGGTKQLQKTKPKMSSLEYFYDDYIKNKNAAASIDTKILDYKKTEIADCEIKFVKPYLALRNTKNEEKKVAGQKATQEAEKAIIIAQNKAKNEHQQMMKFAEKMGFSNGYFMGIRLLLNEISSTAYTQDELKNMLIVTDNMDGYFTLQSITDEYAIYSYSFGSDFAQIALLRKPGKAYLQDSELPDTVFGYAGLEEFKNALGGMVQLAVLKEIR